MEMTMFLAGLWGPAMLAIGIGMFINRGHYIKIYRDLAREPFAVMIFGMAAVVVGMAQVNAHNIWETLPEMLVSLLGWLLLLKGLACVIMPNWVERSGHWMDNNLQMLTTSSAVLVIIGVYLTWSVYFT
ncbi:hypothetical protein A2392_01895 [Candidatus Kaiserbacteria bacterium RIFOXYB1_FULL_46_14]|uniref:Uncharacterized protein n=1 Tax=Candidatus Kaiserbacteria bacterium RIFOXYB1_FULL_46_14 TaxID=1798531 RepID=A0A1F6FK12_9BACT|nr:MAG: hypothetical protein A2392_01895 [Candidatus Kaiserbacteria bacterium RIFOXYB1_FULL_46_14]